MIQTNRIISGFDVELQVGAGWFLAAFRALNDRGLLLPGGPPPPFDPDAPVTVDSVEIVFDVPNRDLRAQVSIDGIPLTILISLELSDEGDELIITSTVPDSDPINVPFDALSGLAGPPRLRKLSGDWQHDPCIAFLANLDLRASPQDQEPLPEGEHVERGTELAISFLPAGQDIVIGIGAGTFPLIANDIWHTSLRAEDGSHPFPDEEDKEGNWKSAKAEAQDGRIRITLKAEAEVFGPNADVTIEIDLTPGVAEGLVTFEIEVDTDVDTGILGSIFAFFVGGILGFFVGLILGRSLIGGAIGAGVGALGGVILVELKEAANERKIKRRVLASLEGEEIPPIYTCEDGVVVEAEPDEEDEGLVGSFVNAIPRSIPVGSDRPDPLHERTVVVEAVYDDFQIDSSGLAFAGRVQAGERFQPLPAALVGRRRENGQLEALIYRTPDDEEVEIALDVVFERMAEAELRAPYKLGIPPAESKPRRPAGRLPSVCLSPDAIRRSETVVREIRFKTGLDLRAAETVALQDAGAVILLGLQLIHPKNANPYFRAPADDSVENNFESLPAF
jgi:hypothetical protein